MLVPIGLSVETPLGIANGRSAREKTLGGLSVEMAVKRSPVYPFELEVSEAAAEALVDADVDVEVLLLEDDSVLLVTRVVAVSDSALDSGVVVVEAILSVLVAWYVETIVDELLMIVE